MQQITGNALEQIKRVLGTEGNAAQITEFPDGILHQELEVGPFVRRGLTPAQSEGIYIAEADNVHAAADSQSSTLDPYGLPEVGATYTLSANAWPNPVPEGLDVWLLGVTAQVSQPGAAGTAWLALSHLLRFQAQNLGGTVYHGLAHYDAQILSAGGLRHLTRAAGTPPDLRPLRIPRGRFLTWQSTSLVASTFTVLLTLGLFPAGLGQDASL